jgi:hypothetical protein
MEKDNNNLEGVLMVKKNGKVIYLDENEILKLFKRVDVSIKR